MDYLQYYLTYTLTKSYRNLNNDNEGHTTKQRMYINTILHADDQILMATFEDELQKWRTT